MTAPASPRAEMPLTCPSCGRVLDLLVVNPAGELIGCEDCAEEMGLAGGVMTLDEWNAPATVEDVLSLYPLNDWQVSKPLLTRSQRPRAHYWEVREGNRQYFLKRFHDWYPLSAIRFTHSVLAGLSTQGLPVPHWVADRSGQSVTCADGSNWALYAALDGHHASDQEWMWGRPKAAEMLATLHLGLERITPEGEAFQPWNAWTLDTVDRVLDSWQPHPDLPADLLAFVRDRLATRYFGNLYPQLPKLIVHGDYVLSNVLWRGDAISSSICGVLDFERAHSDTALFDFAWGLGDRRPPLLRATVATYSKVRPLSAVEREALPEAMLLGALMGLDMQMTYFQDMHEVNRLAHELNVLVRDLEQLRRAVAVRTPAAF